MPNQPKRAVVRDQPKKMSKAVMSVAGATTWPSIFRSGGSSCRTLGGAPTGGSRLSAASLDSPCGAIGLSVVRRTATRPGVRRPGARDVRRGGGRPRARDVRRGAGVRGRAVRRRARPVEPVGSVAVLLRLGENSHRRSSLGPARGVVAGEAGARAVLELDAEVVTAARSDEQVRDAGPDLVQGHVLARDRRHIDGRTRRLVAPVSTAAVATAAA